MADDLYRPGLTYPAPHSESAPLTEDVYRPSYGLYPTSYPDFYPPLQSSTRQPHGDYRLLSRDRSTVISRRTDEYHFDIPPKGCELPPPDYDSVFRPSKMTKIEEYGLPIPQHRETVTENLGDADDEPHLYHKRPVPDTIVMRGLDIFRNSRAPETTFGRLSESDFAEGTSQVLRPRDRPMLVPLGPKNTVKTPKAASKGTKVQSVVIPKVLRLSRSKLKTCQNLMDTTRVSLAKRYESDLKMKKPAVYQKLGELDTYLRQVEDGLAGALALVDEFCQP
ncbi:hypothetical protein MMC30_002062 [Trapelia coarctata]|nr:hypothetical protein [Trapelia coarctata]